MSVVIALKKKNGNFILAADSQLSGDYTISILQNGDIIFEGNEVAPRDYQQN